MLKRGVVVLVALFVIAAASCSKDDRAEPGSTSTASTATAATGTTVRPPGLTETTSSSQVSVPPVTPPAGQPAVCSLLSPSTLEAVGVTDTTGSAADHPDADVPNTTCTWSDDPDLTVCLYYGRDPLEILATVRQANPGGVDVTGVGQDAYLDRFALFVDGGSQAFVVAGRPQDQLQALAQEVIHNL